MTGYSLTEGERTKALAELIRTSTSILWNLQVAEESKLRPAELWPLPWDKPEDSGIEIVSNEEYQRRETAAAEYLNKM
jgi:hypothetical protein